MIVPDYVTPRQGVVVSSKPIKCPLCNESINMNTLYYANLHDWSEFSTLLGSSEIEKLICEHCNNQFPAKSPLVLEIPYRNILIFVTHGGDDGGVEIGFKKWLEFIAMLVNSSTMSRLKQRPYTFVHGWDGLKALLNVFDDKEYYQPDNPYPHATENRIAIATLHGYKYGKLMFYYPDQLGLEDTISTLLMFSNHASTTYQEKMILPLMIECAEAIDNSHPWLAQEIGRLSLQMKNYPQADRWLQKAVDLQHKWVAVTTSFRDFTPTKRADGVTQVEDLPHVLPASTLGDVLQYRHVVTRFYPAKSDYGLWHFPAMESYAYHTNPKRNIEAIQNKLTNLRRDWNNSQNPLVSHYQLVIDMIIAYCKGDKALQQQIEETLDNIGTQAEQAELVESLRRITFQGARIEKRLIDLLESKDEIAVIREILHQLN